MDWAKSAKGLKSDCVASSVCCVRSAGKEDILSFPVGVSGEWRIFPGILCTGVFLDAIALPPPGSYRNALPPLIGGHERR